jgi:lipid-binding SYLF domain-containing protein
MQTSFRNLILASAVLLALGGAQLQAAPRETSTMEAAGEVLDALADIPLKGIPPALLQDAQGVAIIPNVIKAGFVIGGRHGHGVLLVRQPDGSWSKPVLITLTGGSVGWQAGVQSTDLVLVFKTRNSLDRILQGKGKLTLGADAAVAAGPVGRQAEAGTDGQLKAEIFSYSRSRGLFAGVSLEGAALVMDSKATEAYYRSEINTFVDPATGAVVPVTPPSVLLCMKLAKYCAPMPVPPVPEPSAPILPVPQPLPMNPPPLQIVPPPPPQPNPQ